MVRTTTTRSDEDKETIFAVGGMAGKGWVEPELIDMIRKRKKRERFGE